VTSPARSGRSPSRRRSTPTGTRRRSNTPCSPAPTSTRRPGRSLSRSTPSSGEPVRSTVRPRRRTTRRCSASTHTRTSVTVRWPTSGRAKCRRGSSGSPGPSHRPPSASFTASWLASSRPPSATGAWRAARARGRACRSGSRSGSSPCRPRWWPAFSPPPPIDIGRCSSWPPARGCGRARSSVSRSTGSTSCGDR
jgi:hypothetical protein